MLKPSLPAVSFPSFIDSGEVNSFGGGTMGQLGHGDRDDRLTLKIGVWET